MKKRLVLKKSVKRFLDELKAFAVALLLVVGWLYMYMAAAVQYLDKW